MRGWNSRIVDLTTQPIAAEGWIPWLSADAAMSLTRLCVNDETGRHATLKMSWLIAVRVRIPFHAPQTKMYPRCFSCGRSWIGDTLLCRVCQKTSASKPDEVTPNPQLDPKHSEEYYKERGLPAY